jgi:hypothetical protein
MLASTLYGLLLVLAFFALCRLAPQPAGSIVYWMLVTSQLSFAALRTWSRTRLPLATASMASAAIGAALVAGSVALGHTFPFLPIHWAPFVYRLLVVAVVCLIAESRLHRRKWMRWAAHMEHVTVLDIVRGRHIPELRDAD